MARSRQLRKDLEPFAVKVFRLDQCEGPTSVVLVFGDGAEFLLPDARSAKLPRTVSTLLALLESFSAQHFQESLQAGTIKP